ncbi:MAG: matrixin family metalloprotease [bacterium]|nr:matrixin family metalloprotease [bacterium]
MSRVMKDIIALLMLGALAYTFRAPLEKYFGGLAANLKAIYMPCQSPIMYSLGAFDSRFGISKQDFLQAIKDAEAIWEKPLGKNLFAYSSDGQLEINLVYDYRQEATSKLKNLGLAVDETRASYDALQAKYAEIKSALSQAKALYDSKVSAFEKMLDAYNKEVESWNRKGGAPKYEFARLEAERASISAASTDIQALQKKVNGYVDEVNALAVVLNGMANALNVDVGKYNAVGASRGEEFTEADYQNDGMEQKIDIYEFTSRNKLVRVLAHELGHALDLEHVEGSTSIMYKLNESTNENLSANDIAELKSKCGIK